MTTVGYVVCLFFLKRVYRNLTITPSSVCFLSEKEFFCVLRSTGLNLIFALKCKPDEQLKCAVIWWLGVELARISVGFYGRLMVTKSGDQFSGKPFNILDVTVNEIYHGFSRRVFV